MKYSIIIPHKNIPDLLARCLRSIPVREDIQVIVVDDNSDGVDLYKKNIPELSRSNVEFHATKEGRGAGYARNVGMKYALGKWILFADADDFFVEHWIDAVEHFFESENDVVVFKIKCCKSEYVAVECSSSWHNKHLEQYDQNQSSARDVLFNCPGPWAKLVRKDFIEKNKIRFEEISNANDIGFAVRIAVCSQQISIANDILYCVTSRHGSLTTNVTEDALRIRYEALKRVHNYAFQNGYLQYERPPVIEFLVRWRRLGVMKYLRFIWMERGEIKRTKKLKLDNKPFDYRHPYLYALLVFLQMF